MRQLMIAALVLASWQAQAQTQGTAQEQVEKTIGSLVVANATCSQNTTMLSSALEAARKEIADLKAKAVPPVDNGGPGNYAPPK